MNLLCQFILTRQTGLQKFILGSLILVAIAVSQSAWAKYASVVIDANTGAVLHQTNGNTQNYPASLTKMMTLYLTFEAIDQGKLSWSQPLPISRVAASRSPSKLWLKPGNTITVRDAVLALIVRSANDAATVIAEALAGSERKFAKKMTRKARKLGMGRTTFRNASGLPNRAQLTTARDMATLARALIHKFPHHYPLFKTRRFTWEGNTYRTHNRLLERYPGADGLKTGYIRASGFQLVFSAQRKGQRLIGVVMGGKTAKKRDRHMARLMDKGFSKVKTRVAQILPKHAWGVQVGAFYQDRLARRAAKRATQVAPELLSKTQVTIVTRKSNTKRTLHLARLMGLGRKEAQEACQSLGEKKMDCMIVQSI